MKEHYLLEYRKLLYIFFSNLKPQDEFSAKIENLYIKAVHIIRY